MAQAKLKPRAVANRRGARRALCPPPLGQAHAFRQHAARSMSCQLAQIRRRPNAPGPFHRHRAGALKFGSPGSLPDATLRPAIATVIDRCRRPIGGKRRAIDSPSSPLAWRKEQSWTWIRASQLLLGFGLNLDSAPFRLSETAGSHRRDDDRAGEDVPDIGVDVHLCQPVAEHAKNQDSGESGQDLRLALLSHRLS